MKIKVWLDSGANCQSQYTQIVDTDKELGMKDEEWNALSEKDKEEIMREIAFNHSDWGFVEV